MNVLKVKKGETLAKKQDKVMEWYLIQEGSVIRQFAFAEIIMHRNAIVGILENEWFACDYVANEDTTLIVIPCKNAQDLRKILSEHENFRPIFLRTAVEQRHQALCLYASLQKKCMRKNVSLSGNDRLGCGQVQVRDSLQRIQKSVQREAS